MKKFLGVSYFFFLGFQLILAQEYFNTRENQHRNHLIIVHPTRANLERYSYLIGQGFLDPGKNSVVGVYFESEAYEYEEIIKNFPQFGFHCIRGEISLEDIFQKNPATEEFEKIFRYSRGIIFNGGPDIPPAIYGEEMSTLTVVTDPYRHYSEVSFLFHLLGGEMNEDLEPFLKKRPRYAILGICLGMQTMNVAAGGTLVQDIPLEIYEKSSVELILSQDYDLQHRNYYSDMNLYPEINSYFPHKIKLIPGRWLQKELKYKGEPEPSVFSAHHQAVDELGKDFRVAATSLDGKIVEAIEHKNYPNVLGIQFHPEVDDLYQDKKEFKFRPEDESFSLMDELVKRNSLDFHLQFWKAFSQNL